MSSTPCSPRWPRPRARRRSPTRCSRRCSDRSRSRTPSGRGSGSSPTCAPPIPRRSPPRSAPCVTFDARDRLPELSVRALVIAGQHEGNDADQQELADLLDAHCVFLPGTSHLAPVEVAPTRRSAAARWCRSEVAASARASVGASARASTGASSVASGPRRLRAMKFGTLPHVPGAALDDHRAGVRRGVRARRPRRGARLRQRVGARAALLRLLRVPRRARHGRRTSSVGRRACASAPRSSTSRSRIRCASPSAPRCSTASATAASTCASGAATSGPRTWCSRWRRPTTKARLHRVARHRPRRVDGGAARLRRRVLPLPARAHLARAGAAARGGAADERRRHHADRGDRRARACRSRWRHRSRR